MRSVAIAHDYLTQRGGAERVVLALLKAFPEAAVYTSLYHREETFPEFRDVEIHATFLNRMKPMRARHRLLFPALAPTFSRLRVPAEVTVCSSSGWAHGVVAAGRKVVYCHNPARWLYQTEQYLGKHPGVAGLGLKALGPSLRRWDRRLAATAHRYLTTSRVVQVRIAAKLRHRGRGGAASTVDDLVRGFGAGARHRSGIFPLRFEALALQAHRLGG